MKKAEKQSVIYALGISIITLGMVLGLSACSQTGTDNGSRVYTNRAEVREAPAARTGANTALPSTNTGYNEKNRSEFMVGCRQSCAAKDKTHETAAFCEMYCDCTHAGLRMKVPYRDLQTLSEGKKPSSIKTIESIQNQCLRDAASSQAQKNRS
jgi:hypothetical protein